MRCCVTTDLRIRLRQPPRIPQVCEGKGEPDLVSVLIPTYNRGYILPQAIASVLAQTYRSFEVIVVDDGSSDNTRQIVEQFGSQIRYIYQENAGLGSARNAGLAMARGEFIAFQDSDDLWMPWKLEVQVALLRRYPQVAFTWTDVTAVNEFGKLLGERHLPKILGAYSKINASRTFPISGVVKDICPACPPEITEERYRCGDIFDAMVFGNLIHPPTVLMRRENIRMTGGEDVNFTNCGEDYEFFFRLARTGWGAIVDCPGMFYRVGAKDQYTNADTLPQSYGYLYTLKNRLEADRHRIKLSESEIRKCLAGAYTWMFEQELRSLRGRWLPNYIWKSLWLNPYQPRLLLLLPFGFLPRFFFQLALALKRRVRG
jgi:glycosyltransferase involved in cell wall biosynthesis